MVWALLNLEEPQPLDGSFDAPEHIEFSMKRWWDGDYQNTQQELLRETIGLRSLFVRTYNQLQYSFFNIARANGVQKGKDGHLYQENYLRAIRGTDFIGDSVIEAKVAAMEEVGRELAKSDTRLLIVLAPGKGSYFSEHIPEEWKMVEKGRTNYEGYRESLEHSEVEFLDFHSWFRSMKAESEFPLFPRTGIHWSKYGEVMAADSLSAHIQYLTDREMPRIVIDEVEWSDEMRDTDDDIEKSMNLIFDIEDERMAYPIFHVEAPEEKGPKTLTIADSYYWGMFNYGFYNTLFGGGEFWFYNELIYPYNEHGEADKVADRDIRAEAESSDVIVLLSTDANLHRFPFGFIEQLHDDYFPTAASQERSYEQRVKSYIDGIMETPEWLYGITLEAEEKGIALEEALRKNAEYMIWQEGQD